MSISHTLHRLGGIAVRSQLLAAGATPRQIAAAVHRGEIQRVRRAWYAGPEATAEQFAAVRIGGILGGVSAATTYGIWAPPVDSLHVSVARNGSRLRPPPETAGPVLLDWTRDPLTISASRPAWRVSPEEALAQAFRIIRDDEAIAMADSAIRLGLIAPSSPLLCAAPWREEIDPTAEAGIETLVRVRLRRAGLPVRTQVVIPSVGRVDVLVGDRLVIETDGREFHADEERFARDRIRDLQLAALDLRCVRLTYAQVIYDWDGTMDAILRLVGRGEHLQRVSFVRIDGADTPVVPARGGMSLASS